MSTCSNNCGLPMFRFKNHLGTYSYYCQECDENTWNRNR